MQDFSFMLLTPRQEGSMYALTVDDHRWLLRVRRIAVWLLWIGWCIAIALGRALNVHNPFLLGS